MSPQEDHSCSYAAGRPQGRRLGASGTSQRSAHAGCLPQSQAVQLEALLAAMTEGKRHAPSAARAVGFERQFAEFLERAPDILRFAALDTTEHGASGAAFRVDHVKPGGAIGFHQPDWVAVHRDISGQVIHWVIETKGRVWEGVKEKDAAMRGWCQSVSRATGDLWKYIRVNQAEFRDDFPTFRVLIFTVVGNAVKRKREASGVTVTTEEILRWRDEGRKWL